MNRGSDFQPRPPSRQRDLLVSGLQLAAGLMMAHQIAGKAARDGLFLVQHGAAALPAMIAGAAGFSIAFSLLGGMLMYRSAPRDLLPWALGASGLLQLGEWWLLRLRPGTASVLIYLHMSGLGAILLSWFWSMLNEEFDPREAKQRFGQIAAGGTAGGLIGGLAAERTVAWLGAPPLMLGLAGLHLVCGAFLAFLNRGAQPAAPHPTEENLQAAWKKAVPRSPLLVTLAAIVLLGSIGAALLDYVFKVYATQTWGRDHGLLRFFAIFYTGVALVSFLLQSAAARISLAKFGLAKTISALPATLLGGSFLSLLAPGAAVAAAARAAEAAVRGSLFRAGYETCYTPVPAPEKRPAKAFVDVASEKGGDAIGAAIILLCVALAGSTALPWILGMASLVGLASLILSTALDGIYVKALAKSLISRAVSLKPDSDMDLTTRTLIFKAGTIPRAEDRPSGGRAESGAREGFGDDAVLSKLRDLRSADPMRVQEALTGCDVSDPLIATQVCLLLGNDQFALLAHAALFTSPGKVLGLLSDLLMNPSLEVSVRRRIPRIIGSAPEQRAIDALVAGLEDSRFEVRLQCGRALAKATAQEPRWAIPREKIHSAVDRELSIGKLLWESHRKQQGEPHLFGPEGLDELLLDKAHGSLEYVFTLLSLVHDRTPLMAAFRSLHVEDNYLRGTALEYLEGILPTHTREMLWEIIQERPAPGDRRIGDVMADLMNSSQTVILRLRDQKSPHS
jgi:ATP:ADP antiporter, AAA family